MGINLGQPLFKTNTIGRVPHKNSHPLSCKSFLKRFRMFNPELSLLRVSGPGRSNVIHGVPETGSDKFRLSGCRPERAV
ncbi:MAG: hypothetical protein MI975_18625 [Cytophagales bacterium]|nr:hypothetical protein [Cytophagales bacterium]